MFIFWHSSSVRYLLSYIIMQIYRIKTKYKNCQNINTNSSMSLNAKNWAISNNFPTDVKNLDIIFV